MNETIYINGTDVLNLGANAMRDYRIGGTEITNDYFQGRNRTYYNVLSKVFGLKTVWFELAFEGKTRHDVMLKKSTVDAQMFNAAELYMPDGFFYRCMLDSVGEISWQGVDGGGVLGIVKYSLTGMQHDQIVSAASPVYASGTMPKMDCALSVTVGTSAATYNLAGAVFANVTAGEKLVFDGIHKRILRNGAPGAAGVTWINFPTVSPGLNTFSAPDAVTVEYYPCYM